MPTLLIAGLGNPGVKYQNTRHNIGFMVLDFLSEELGFEFKFDKKFNSEIAFLNTQTQINPIFFLKPHTFMNCSGEAIAPFVRYHNITHILVVHDELDISFGDIRFKYGGSSGGHNGLKSIDKMMGNEYLRLRFGIGRSVGEDVINYVLSNFSIEQKMQLKPLMEVVKSAILSLCAMSENEPQKLLAYLQNHFTRRQKFHQITPASCGESK